MEKKSKVNLSVIIPVMGVIVAALVLLFGNNIFDRFTGSKILLESTKVMLNYPNDMRQALDEYSTKNKVSFFPDCYRVITIRNTGFTASKNANIQIKVGGDIFDVSSFSTENVSEKKQIDNCTYNIQMPRLSKNAYIEIKFWSKDNNQPISVIYADDYNSRQLIENDLSSGSSPIIQILAVAVIIILVIFLGKQMLLKIVKNMEEKRVQQDYEMIMKLSDMIISEKEDDKEKEEVDLQKDQQVSLQDEEETKEKLKRLIRKVKDM